jgi:hypothetical protein
MEAPATGEGRRWRQQIAYSSIVCCTRGGQAPLVRGPCRGERVSGDWARFARCGKQQRRAPSPAPNLWRPIPPASDWTFSPPVRPELTSGGAWPAAPAHCGHSTCTAPPPVGLPGGTRVCAAMVPLSLRSRGPHAAAECRGAPEKLSQRAPLTAGGPHTAAQLGQGRSSAGKGLRAAAATPPREARAARPPARGHDKGLWSVFVGAKPGAEAPSVRGWEGVGGAARGPVTKGPRPRGPRCPACMARSPVLGWFVPYAAAEGVPCPGQCPASGPRTKSAPSPPALLALPAPLCACPAAAMGFVFQDAPSLSHSIRSVL